MPSRGYYVVKGCIVAGSSPALTAICFHKKYNQCNLNNLTMNNMTIAQQLQISCFPLVIKDRKGNLAYTEDENGNWVKTIYNDAGLMIRREDSKGGYENLAYDDNGNVVWAADNTGYWYKFKFNERGEHLYYENSLGDLCIREYDENGNCVYYETQEGVQFDYRNVVVTIDEIAEKFGIPANLLKIQFAKNI
jgi:YD repeat-containing protein